ncbi:hypothetical protein O181_078190 [Austropuccinia psidii MF-1]|uniref:Uncharacterized protein n=1 Tax=Austropuccinia psidii MF-1 TaxID=1389203 RepID=A0A9Q3FJA9_9BASI|nr:hypothetical protein [Austropuccinia psidii MF-1]
MSSKLTEITESFPSAPPPSVLFGTGILSWLASPWSMASSGHFDTGQTYDGYKAVEVLDPSCTECFAKGNDFSASNVRSYLWSKKDGPFGKELPFSEGPTPDATSGYSDLTGSRWRDVARWTNVGGSIPVGGRPIYSSSAVQISRIHTEGVVKKISTIASSPPDPDAEFSDELDGEEAEVVNNLDGHQSRTSHAQHPDEIFQSCLIPSTPRNSQPTLASIPTSPSSSHTRPAINPAVNPSPIQQSNLHP